MIVNTLKSINMNANQKKAYNWDNESNYHFAPFTPQRAELRRLWNGTRKNWETFLYNAERNHKKAKLC